MQDFIFYGSDVVVIIGLILLSIVSLLNQGSKKPLNRYFSIFSILLSIFLATNDLSDMAWLGYYGALYINYVTFASSFLTVLVLVKFVATLVNDDKFNIIVRRSWYPLIAIGLTGASPFVVDSVFNDNGAYAVRYGSLIWLFALGLFYMLALMLYAIIHGLRQSKGAKKHQIVATGIGIVASIPLSIIISLIIPLVTGWMWITYFGTFPFIFLVFCLYYGVVRYGMFDIRSAAVRSLAYVLSLGVLVGIYYLVANVVSSLFLEGNQAIGQNPLSIGLALGLLFIFQPIKKFFDRLTNSIFYRDNYNSDEFFARFNRLLASTINTRYLLECTAAEIADTLKSEQAFFYIHSSNNHYVTAGTDKHHQLSKSDVEILQSTYGKRPDVIVASMLDEDSLIRILMESNQIELILPLIQDDVIGYLCVGGHRTSHYTNRGIKVLSTISNGLVIAIRHTLSIQEIRDINAQNLQNKIDAATKELRTSNELLQHVDAEKDEFVSVASHELRTPMTVIRGYINILQRGTLTDSQKSILEKMNINTKALIDLVNDMLDLTKLESNKLEVTLVNNSLITMITSSIEEMKLLYQVKGVELSFGGPDAIVSTDAENFDRILMNLLSNAYKFTPGGGKVTVTTTISKTDKLATVCVADTGIGISAEGLETLFKKFSQVDNYLQRKSGGTGLGLSICKGLVEKMGGKIWADSVPGKGSKFYFTVVMNDAV